MEEITSVKIKPLRIPRGFSSIIILCVYIPAWDESTRTRVLHLLSNYLSEAIAVTGSGTNPLIYIAGDLNGINTASLCCSFNLHQINNQPTRLNNVLDIILTNAPSCYNCSTLPPIGQSDHLTVLASPSEHTYKLTKPPATKIQVRSGKIRNTVAEIRRVNWQTTIPFSDINFIFSNAQRAYDTFYDTLNNAQNLHQPLRMVKTKDDQPWMTAEIKQLIIERQRLFFQEHGPKWKQMRAKVRALIQKRKKSYNSTLTTGNAKAWR